jgi:peptidoglycan/LPS O-acetylase OafA/YrhL
MLEPLRQSIGVSLGTLAVDVFFFTSGFLVTASLLSRTSAIDFVWGRGLRIYPALVVMVALTVGVLGPLFTTLDPAQYLHAYGTRAYLVYNSTVLSDVINFLPGVFANNPWPGAVNGSLWTLPYEVRMYATLLLAWILLRVAGHRRPSLMRLLIPTAAAISGLLLLLKSSGDAHLGEPGLRLFFMFFAGSSYQVFKDRIRLHTAGAVLAATAITACALFTPRHFTAVFMFTMPYLLLYLAFVPAGLLRKYNSMGDYSYGVYIYAFPVQQVLVALFPGISVLSLLLLSALGTLTLAALSWHLIEERCLRLKQTLSNHTHRLLRLGSTTY